MRDREVGVFGPQGFEVLRRQATGDRGGVGGTRVEMKDVDHGETPACR
jgi:hypothetical protein